MKFFGKNNKVNRNLKDPVIVFHEDFYRQVELVPEENYFERNGYIDNLPSNPGNENGFEYCTARDEQPIKISGMKILLEDVKELLAPLASSFFAHVEAAYGSSITYRKENTVVWGFDRYGIFVETNKISMVESFYICHNSHFLNDNNGFLFSKALTVLSQKYKLVLVDWNQEIVVRTSSITKTKNYLMSVLNFDIRE